MNDFAPVEIVSATHITKGQAVTIEFKLDSSYQSGQHVTIKTNVEGDQHRRSYSLASSPHCDSLAQLTIKRVKNGLVSNFLCDTLKQGGAISISKPYGNFVLELDKEKARTHYFYAGGSGITPIISMMKSVLQEEPYSVAHLLYGNKNEDSIIYLQELRDLEALHAERCSIAHVLSKQSMWSGFKPWQRGRINAELVEKHLAENRPYAQDTHYYVCGPGTMNLDVKRFLNGIDVPGDRIHAEQFSADEEPDMSVTGRSAKMLIELNGEPQELNVIEGQTLLDAARVNGVDIPFSCQSGVCGACKASLLDGEVHMRSSSALTKEELDNGKILVCQSVAQSEIIIITY